MLTADQEVQSAVAAEAGVLAQARIEDGADREHLEDLREMVRVGRDAFDRLVVCNMRLPAWMARRRCAAGAHGGLSVDDLTQEGMLGLIRAVHKFDYTMGVKFSTYAVRWIASFQQRAVWANLPVHLDSHTAELLASLDAVTAHHWGLHGERPSLEVICDQLGIRRERALELTLLQRRDTRSLSEPLGRGEGGATLQDLLEDTDPGPEALAETSDLRRRLVQAVRGLDAREQRVIAARIGLGSQVPMNGAAAAAALGVDPAQANEVAASALVKLRRAMGHNAVGDQVSAA